jgi:NADPH2:quinone reductase
MRAWVLREYGEPGDVLDLGELPVPEPQPHQTLVAVEAVGIAFPDLLRIRGKYQIQQPLGSPPGSELVGHVIASGADDGFAPGTRVIGISQIGDGALAEFALIPTVEACAVADDMPASVAATLPANYVTAYLALVLRAGLRAGESVLVTGGAGGVGSAASQLAAADGARVIAADLGLDRARLCVDFGAEVGIDTESQDLAAEVNAFTDGRGVDVVVDTVGGDVFDAVRRCIAPEGRVVVVGFTSGRIPELRANHLILRNFTVMGVNAFFYTPRWGELTRHVVDLAAAGRIAPPIDREYAFDDVLVAFEQLARGEVRGRAVVRVAA